MKKILVILALVAAVMYVTRGASAVTVTVPGDFGDLATAIDNTDAGDGDDTIIVAEDQVITSRQSLFAANEGKLTIKAADGVRPIILCGNGFGDEQMFWTRGAGEYVFDGLTVVAPNAPLKNGTDAMPMRALFWCETGAAGETLKVTIKNCLVTANDGTGQPVTNYSSFDTSVAAGQFQHWIKMNEDTLDDNTDILIENSTLACAGNYGIATRNGVAGITTNITIRGSILIASDASMLSISDNADNSTVMTVTVENSLLAKDRNHNIFRGADNSFDLYITDSILAYALDGQLISWGDHKGVFSAVRSTFYNENANEECIRYAASTGGSVNLDHVILGRNGLYIDDGSGLTSVTMANVGGIDGIDNGQSQIVVDALNALYGGAGFFQADPEFVSVDLAQVDGDIGWVKGNNTLFDVGNVAYKGKGLQGDTAPEWKALLGGGDAGPGVPVELSSFQVE